MKTFTAVRQDTRFGRPQRAVVSVAREVFRAPPGSGGPAWILDPPPETIRRFWERFGPAILPDTPVFVAEGKVLIEQVQDAHDRPVPGLAGHAGEAALFFVDLEPMAEWAHPCAYILWPDEGEPLHVEHRWPPAESIRLVPLPLRALP